MSGLIKNFNRLLSQKNKSLKNLYSHIYHASPVTKRELIQLSNLTQTTCTRLIDELLDAKLIEASGYDVSTGGRKPILYKINADSHFVFGIDISRTYVKVLLLNLDLYVLEDRILSLESTSTSAGIINFIINEINKMIQNRAIGKSSILGIGIGSVGPLDRDNGIILDPAYTPASRWGNIPVKETLEKSLDLDVFMDYGVNTALLAEYQHLPDNTYMHIAHIINGVGIRSGFILDGQLMKGSSKFSRFGQGHTIVDIDGRKCTCGNHGCVQAYATIGPLLQEANSRMSINHHAAGDITFDQLCEAVENGDHICSEIVKEAAYFAGAGLANIINLLQLDLIILGGPVYRKLDLFFETAKKTALKTISRLDPDEKIVITRGVLGSNATAIGAGSTVLQYYLQQ